MSSWREAAGREGDDAYKFGDLSRSLLRRTSAIAQATKETGSRVVQRASDTFSHEDRPASTLTWKESAGRDDGDDAYAFGDLSRTVVKKIGGGEAARASRLDAIFAAGRDTDAVRRAIGGCLAADAPAAFIAATLRRRAELRTVVDCAAAASLTLVAARVLAERDDAAAAVDAVDSDALRLATTALGRRPAEPFERFSASRDFPRLVRGSSAARSVARRWPRRPARARPRASPRGARARSTG